MNKKTKSLTTLGLLAAALSQIHNASAHMEPKVNDGTEKCYGIAKAHKNDCASKANKHSCATMAKVDNDPNEWVTTPKGVCEKTLGGSKTPKDPS